MNLKNVRVAPKLWATILGLLVVMLLTNLWVRSNTEQALEQSREDVQRIERKIALAQHMRGAAMTGLEMGIAQFATNERRLQMELEKRFEKRRAISSAALNAMEKALHTDEDRAQFEMLLKLRKSVETTRAQAESNLDAEDYNARSNFAFSEYAAIGEKYSEGFDRFIQYQMGQLAVVTQQAEARRQSSAIVGWGITVLLLLVGVLLAHWLVKTVTQPLERAVQAAESIGNGDLTISVKTQRGDEFGHLLNALDHMAARLRSVVSEVRTGVESVSAASTQIATGNQDLSARTEQTAANLEETAASMEELTSTVTQSSETARQANQLAGSAAQAAERGGAVVQQVVHSMQQITDSSRRIGDIIGVIDGIAFQTNILALNAAVEAARAGEQGRGFAVVAGEVRSLAGRSAEAAKEIKALISASVSNVESGSQQVEQAGQSMQEIVQSVRRVTDLIAEISAASIEQREGIGQVNQAIGNLDQMTQQNAALVEESSAAAVAMHEQAQRLSQVVSVFNVGQQAPAALAAVRAPMRQPVAAPRMAVNPPARAAAQQPAKTAGSRPMQPPALAPAPMGKAPLRRPGEQHATTADDSDWESF